MFEFMVQPDVYATNSHRTLGDLLEEIWIKKSTLGRGTIYIVSGFANFNGAVPFISHFNKHIEGGGEVFAIFGGSLNQSLTSKQLVVELLKIGVRVYLVNWNQLMHMKCYGYSHGSFESLVISSGNFTSAGLSKNVESSVYFDNKLISKSNFSWDKFESDMITFSWELHRCSLNKPNESYWNLLYDENASKSKTHTSPIESVNLQTMVMTLSPTDTNRILANKGDNAGKGSQYFWLTKSCIDFFPALTIQNKRGVKRTYSAEIELEYIDLNISNWEKITLEAENNLDFRLGTGKLRYTKIAKPEDLVCISRLDEMKYELRIVGKGNPLYSKLLKFAIHPIGNKGKIFGYIDNNKFTKILAST